MKHYETKIQVGVRTIDHGNGAVVVMGGWSGRFEDELPKEHFEAAKRAFLEKVGNLTYEEWKRNAVELPS